MSGATLVFVYNADTGLFNAIADMAHKLFSPETYACNLCAITHSHLGMRREWQQFINGLKIPVEFLHRNEWRETYGPTRVPLPAIFIKRPHNHQTEPELWLDAGAINACRTLPDLITLIKTNFDHLTR